MNKILLNVNQNIDINLYPKEDSETVVVLIHGASEGATRYHQMATELNQYYNVITYNHPGHETGSVVNFEYNEIIDHTIKVINYAQANFKKVTIFAHSMGSLIIRETLVYLREDTKLIFSGAPVIGFVDRISTYCGLIALQVMNKDKVSAKLNHLVFDQKAKKIGLDNKQWLSSQSQIVEIFKSSKLYNQPFNNRSLEVLLDLTLNANRKDVYRKLSHHPLFLVSGSTDGFTNNGLNYRFITKYAKTAKVKVYPNSYHEIHNDIDRKQLFKDMIKFIEKEQNGKN